MSDHIELAKKLHRLVISSNVNEAILAAVFLSIEASPFLLEGEPLLRRGMAGFGMRGNTG